MAAGLVAGSLPQCRIAPALQRSWEVRMSRKKLFYGQTAPRAGCRLAARGSQLIAHWPLITALMWPCRALAQASSPTKPIRFISPFAPGGSTSAVARALGQKLTESWGQQVIVDNRPGGNTIIGTDTLAKATPDGYTIMMATSTLVIMPSLLP